MGAHGRALPGLPPGEPDPAGDGRRSGPARLVSWRQRALQRRQSLWVIEPHGRLRYLRRAAPAEPGDRSGDARVEGGVVPEMVCASPAPSGGVGRARAPNDDWRGPAPDTPRLAQ